MSDLEYFNKEYPHINLVGAPCFDGAFLAGGALTSAFTNNKINDFDFYFKSRKDFENALDKCYSDGLNNLSVSDMAVTYSDISENIIQLMIFDSFDKAQKIFDSFDFTVNMCAVDCDSMKMYMDDRFMPSLASRSLIFNENTKYPIASLTRVNKYMERGFSISRKELIKIGLACSRLDISDYDQIKSQVGGYYGENVSIDDEGEEFRWDNVFYELSKSRFFKREVGPIFDKKKILEKAFKNE